MRNGTAAARILLGQLRAYPSPVSPWTTQADDYVQEWAASFGLIQSAAARSRFRATAPGELAGRVYATAAGSDRLETAAAWIGWLFLIDDQLDEGGTGKDPLLAGERLRPFASMMDGAGAVGTAGSPGAADGRPGPPLLAALADVWRRLADMPASWCAAFARHYAEYLRGCEWEAGNRARGRVPSEPDFLSRRREAGAIFPSLDVLEYAAGAPLPDRARNDPLLAGIREACADVVCWTDDLLTVDKERAHCDVHNLAIVLEHATGCAPREALDMVARRIAARLRDFDLLQEEIAAADGDEYTRHALSCHVQGLQHWMRGHLEWGLRTIRYNADPASPAGYLEDLLS